MGRLSQLNLGGNATLFGQKKDVYDVSDRMYLTFASARLSIQHRIELYAGVRLAEA